MFGLIGKSILTVCAFFGHRDTPATDEIEKKVEETARSLIAQGVTYLHWYLVIFLKQNNHDESMIVNVDLSGL